MSVIQVALRSPPAYSHLRLFRQRAHTRSEKKNCDTGGATAAEIADTTDDETIIRRRKQGCTREDIYLELGITPRLLRERITRLIREGRIAAKAKNGFT